MKLNTTSWHAKLYKFAYRRRPENDRPDGCKYARYVLWAFISLPIYFIGGIIEHYWGTTDPWGERPGYNNVVSTQWVTIIMCAMVLAVGHAVNTSCFDIENYAGFWNGLGLIAIAGCVTTSLLIGFCGIILYSIDRYYCRPVNDQPPGFIASSYKAFKEKHCPIIEWEKPKDKMES